MKVHAYPYDASITDYPDTATGVPLPGQPVWPLLSGQSHWRPANSHPDPTTVPQLGSPSLGHVHMEVRAPIYAELSASVVVPFNIVLFQIDGQVWDISPYGSLIGGTTWDTPDGKIPVMHGDPDGAVTFSGHITIDFSKADGSGVTGRDIPKHGWFHVEFVTRVSFANGDRMDASLVVPFFSVIDPSQPVVVMPQSGSQVASSAGAGSVKDTPTDAVGLFNIAQYNNYLPILAPLTRAIPDASPFLYGYGTGALPPGIAMTRFDMDLHHEDDGFLIQQGTGPSNTGVALQSPFDPAILGQGLHKVAALWSQDTNGGVPGLVVANEQVVGLLVVSVLVGEVPPPQPPTLTGLTPPQGAQSSHVPITLTGTNFIGGAVVNVSGMGVSVLNVAVQSPTTMTATLVVDPMAATGMRSVTVTTAAGTSGPQTFTVTTAVDPWITVASGSGWILQQHGLMSNQMQFCTGPMFSVITPLMVV